MPQDQSNLIPIERPKTAFSSFLQTKDNKRIFFSGKFGIGKTYFLKEFFKDHNLYDVYHLFPTRYQVSSNEDILDLLKYDILVELFKKYPNAFQDEKKEGMKESTKLFLAFCQDSGLINRGLRSVLDVTEGVLSLSPDPLSQILAKLSRPLKDLLKLDQKFQEFKKTNPLNDSASIDTFLKEVSEDIDPSANDYVSNIICTKIKEFKNSKSSVLILDDFDRIDPEHIFRILNALSVYIDDWDENRYGFDHVIIVGDIANIRSIYHHCYGDRTDFTGYFDKFFTIRPFEFDNQQAIAESIHALLGHIKYEEPRLKNALGDTGIITTILREVLKRALATNNLNLRQLYASLNHTFPEVKVGAYNSNQFANALNQCIDISIKLLIGFYGDRETFLRVLSDIQDTSSPLDIERHGLYAADANSMLNRMIDSEGAIQEPWIDKYQLERKSDPHLGDGYYLASSHGKANAKFFYDVLIEYVKTQKYLQTNYYNE